MREIKFRTLNEKNNIEKHRVSFGKDMMLSTGLKDKNGKEIYEGDIIDVDATYGDSDELIKQYGTDRTWKHRYIVEFGEWDDGNDLFGHGWYLKEIFTIWSDGIFDKEDDVTTISKERGMKIIGNIHENPELLEVKNENKD